MHSHGSGVGDQVTTQLGDMRSLPYSDHSFDFVMTSEAMEYLPDVREGISECVRVLRPGGRSLFIATKSSPMGKLVAATWKNKVLDPDTIRIYMLKIGIDHVETLRFPWQVEHVDATIMALLATKS